MTKKCTNCNKPIQKERQELRLRTCMDCAKQADTGSKLYAMRAHGKEGQGFYIDKVLTVKDPFKCH